MFGATDGSSECRVLAGAAVFRELFSVRTGRGADRVKNGNLLLVASPREAPGVVATLERNGFAVTAVPDVLRAGHILERSPSPDLILLDLDVPENCTSAAMAVLASHAPLAFLFGTVPPELVARTEDIPSFGYVPKGAGEALLCAALRRMLVLATEGKPHRKTEFSGVLSCSASPSTESETAEPFPTVKVALLATILDAMPSPVFFKDLQGVYRECNAAFCAFLGRSREEILGATVFDVAPAERAEVYHRADLDLLARGGDQRYETTVPYRDGSCHILFSKAVVRDGEGKPLGLVGIMTDVTERKRAEDVLRSREAYLRAVFDNVPHVLWLKDRQGRYLAANEGLARLYGASSAEDILGRGEHDFWPPEIAECYLAEDRKVMEERTRLFFEQKVQTPEGVRLFETFKTPILDDEGELLGTAGFSLDVTERRAEEERVLERHAQLLAIFDGLEELVFVVDMTTREMLFVNRKTRELFGRDLAGTCCHRSLQAREDVCPFCFLEQLTAEPGTPLRRDVASPVLGRHFAATVTCIPWTDGRPVMLALAMDVTERKRMEEELRRAGEELAEALQERNALLRELQHRIKNSLAIIVSLVRLEANRSEVPAVKESLALVAGRIASLAVLYDALYGSGSVHEVDLAGYLRRLCTSLLDSYGVAGRIVLSVAEEDRVLLEARRAVSVGLMVNELVTNAVKHAFPEGRSGEVTLRVGREGGAVFVDVADDGVGFACEAVQEGGGAEPAAEFLAASGAGSGLRLIDLLAKHLDARVERFAGPEGKGTCFHIVLPEEALSGEVADEG
ncbi:PAS domain-containing protein [Aminiphilus sp.]|uniref:PAS domain-containing protein n=1 Tax=Aminiphilus sp. TaxID=1872488 RepID=UPI00260C2D88|nr:PAS domain-containing protein [Aminiphilus sp.]